MDFKERRKALGLSRAELGEKALVDTRTLQLLELGQSDDEESASRVERTLSALERGEDPPDHREEVGEILRQREGETSVAPAREGDNSV